MRSNNIFTTEITKRDGTKRWVISSQPLSATSNRINTQKNRLLLLALMALSYTKDRANPYFNLSGVNRLIHYRSMVPDVWSIIFTFLPGFTRDVGEYALSIQQPLFFKAISANPSAIINAAIFGQEDIVLNELNADASLLLRTATIKNSVDVEYTVTALQAAIIATDVQLVERMEEHFKKLTIDLHGNSIDGLLEMQKQIKEIYTKSLLRYCEIQKGKIAIFISQQNSGEKIDLKALTTAQEHLILYSQALEQDDISKIFETHNQAQEHNAFDFRPYIHAICVMDENNPIQKAELDAVMELINAKTPEETAAAIDRTGVAPKESDAACVKPFDKLTLVEKLNRFREKLVEHMQQEIIFNPHHILAGLKYNEAIWNAVDAGRFVDPELIKLTIIFFQLAGFAEQSAEESVRQDIRQDTSNLAEQKVARTRPSQFNEYDGDHIVRHSVMDVSLIDRSIIDGWGYKFAPVRWRWGDRRCEASGGGRAGVVSTPFSKIMSSKNSKLLELMQRLLASQKKRQCVIQ